MNSKVLLREANSKIKSYKINDRVDFENLNAYVARIKAPLAMSAEGTMDYYVYFAFQNFCLFIDKCCLLYTSPSPRD